MRISNISLIASHLAFWLLNYWLVAIGSDFNWNGFSAANGSLTYAYIYGLLFNATLFYLQVFWLYPHYYKNNRNRYYLFTGISIILISVLESFSDYLMYEAYAIEKPFLCGFISSLLVHLVYVVAGFYYALKLAFKKSEILKQKLLEENYKSELKYLKAQLNPHFLFNGINNVYHLIGKNNTLAKETLHQFSDLLRYQLYESNTHIVLEKELDTVLKYIKIEETRRGDDISLTYDINSAEPNLKIAPLLLIPFIENAFKHCSNHMDRTKNTIVIRIKAAGGKVYLDVVNSYDSSSQSNSGGGIGLQNVKKRLSMLYSGRHELSIQKQNETHSVTLVINLKKENETT